MKDASRNETNGRFLKKTFRCSISVVYLALLSAAIELFTQRVNCNVCTGVAKKAKSNNNKRK